jgi:hypothetical protein
LILARLRGWLAIAEDLRAYQGVPLHDVPLIPREAVRLEQDMVGDGILPMSCIGLAKKILSTNASTKPSILASSRL